MKKSYDNLSAEKRCEIIASHIINTGCTVRDAAEHFGVSKSTVHKDVSGKLKQNKIELFHLVRVVLEKNKAERHLRGGSATKMKFEKIRNTRSEAE